ncbi:unnamed protein product, partial [marine sediment metagenome]
TLQGALPHTETRSKPIENKVSIFFDNYFTRLFIPKAEIPNNKLEAGLITTFSLLEVVGVIALVASVALCIFAAPEIAIGCLIAGLSLLGLSVFPAFGVCLLQIARRITTTWKKSYQ